MAQDKRVFTGGMDKDSDPRLIKNGDYRHAENIRNVASSDGTSGSVENIESTQVVPFKFINETVDQIIEIDENGFIEEHPPQATQYSQDIFITVNKLEVGGEAQFTMFNVNESNQRVPLGHAYSQIEVFSSWDNVGNSIQNENTFEIIYNLFNSVDGTLSKNIPIVDRTSGEYTTASSSVDFTLNTPVAAGTTIKITITADNPGIDFILDFSSKYSGGVFWSSTVDEYPPYGRLWIEGQGNVTLGSTVSFEGVGEDNAITTTDGSPVGVTPTDGTQDLTQWTLEFNGAEPTTPQDPTNDKLSLFTWTELTGGGFAVEPFFEFGENLFNVGDDFEFSSAQTSLSTALVDHFTNFDSEILSPGVGAPLKTTVTTQGGNFMTGFPSGTKLNGESVSVFNNSANASTDDFYLLNNYHSNDSLGNFVDYSNTVDIQDNIITVEVGGSMSFVGDGDIVQQFPASIKTDRAYLITANISTYSWAKNNPFYFKVGNNLSPAITTTDSDFQWLIPASDIPLWQNNFQLICGDPASSAPSHENIPVEGDKLVMENLTISELKAPVSSLIVTIRAVNHFNLCFDVSAESVKDKLDAGSQISLVQQNFVSGVKATLISEIQSGATYDNLSDDNENLQDNINGLENDLAALQDKLTLMQNSYNSDIAQLEEAVDMDAANSLAISDSINSSKDDLNTQLSNVNNHIATILENLLSGQSENTAGEVAAMQEEINNLQDQLDEALAAASNAEADLQAAQEEYTEATTQAAADAAQDLLDASEEALASEEAAVQEVQDQLDDLHAAIYEAVTGVDASYGVEGDGLTSVNNLISAWDTLSSTSSGIEDKVQEMIDSLNQAFAFTTTSELGTTLETQLDSLQNIVSNVITLKNNLADNPTFTTMSDFWTHVHGIGDFTTDISNEINAINEATTAYANGTSDLSPIDIASLWTVATNNVQSSYTDLINSITALKAEAEAAFNNQNTATTQEQVDLIAEQLAVAQALVEGLESQIAAGGEVAIGNNLAGGVVADIDSANDQFYVIPSSYGYLHPDGTHYGGDHFPRVVWGGADVDNVEGGTSTTGGQELTQKIVDSYAQQNDGVESAAEFCNNYEGGGYTDWFLPSRTELKNIFENKASLTSDNVEFTFISPATAPKGTKFWTSSSHTNRSYAYLVYSEDASIVPEAKATIRNVLPVRVDTISAYTNDVLQTQLEDAQAEVASLQEEYDNSVANLGDDGVTQADVDAVQALLDAANALNAELQADLATAEANVGDGTTQADVDAAQDLLDASDITIENLETELETALANQEDGVSQADVDAAYADGAASVTPEDGITQADVDAIQALLDAANAAESNAGEQAVLAASSVELPNYIGNGNFNDNNPNGWTLGSSWSVVDERLKCSGTSNSHTLYRSSSIDTNITTTGNYIFSYKISGDTTGANLLVNLRFVDSAIEIYQSTHFDTTRDRTVTEIVNITEIPEGNGEFYIQINPYIQNGNYWNGTIDDISLYKVPDDAVISDHAIQQAIGGVSLLLWDFSNVVSQEGATFTQADVDAAAWAGYYMGLETGTVAVTENQESSYLNYLLRLLEKINTKYTETPTHYSQWAYDQASNYTIDSAKEAIDDAIQALIADGTSLGDLNSELSYEISIQEFTINNLNNTIANLNAKNEQLEINLLAFMGAISELSGFVDDFSTGSIQSVLDDLELNTIATSSYVNSFTETYNNNASEVETLIDVLKGKLQGIINNNTSFETAKETYRFVVFGEWDDNLNIGESFVHGGLLAAFGGGSAMGASLYMRNPEIEGYASEHMQVIELLNPDLTSGSSLTNWLLVSCNEFSEAPFMAIGQEDAHETITTDIDADLSEFTQSHLYHNHSHYKILPNPDGEDIVLRLTIKNFDKSSGFPGEAISEELNLVDIENTDITHGLVFEVSIISGPKSNKWEFTIESKAYLPYPGYGLNFDVLQGRATQWNLLDVPAVEAPVVTLGDEILSEVNKTFDGGSDDVTDLNWWGKNLEYNFPSSNPTEAGGVGLEYVNWHYVNNSIDVPFFSTDATIKPDHVLQIAVDLEPNTVYEIGIHAMQKELEVNKTYADWFLPSKDELAKIYANRSAMIASIATDSGGTSFDPLSGMYWSSSEYNSSNAWRVNMDNGITSTAIKSIVNLIRPIRVEKGAGAKTIGDYYNGGFVFHNVGIDVYIVYWHDIDGSGDENGSGNWNGGPWDRNNHGHIGTTGTGIGTGKDNTDDITDEFGVEFSRTESAATSADSFSYNATSLHDWSSLHVDLGSGDLTSTVNHPMSGYSNDLWTNVSMDAGSEYSNGDWGMYNSIDGGDKPFRIRTGPSYSSGYLRLRGSEIAPAGGFQGAVYAVSLKKAEGALMVATDRSYINVLGEKTMEGRTHEERNSSPVYGAALSNAYNGAARQIVKHRASGNAYTTTRIAGGYVCVGAYEDKPKNRVYYFVSHEGDSRKYDSILEYDLMNDAITTVYQDDIGATRFGSKSNTIEGNRILNFSEKHLITGVNKVDDVLYWTDNYNRPRKLNVELAKANDENIQKCKFIFKDSYFHKHESTVFIGGSENHPFKAGDDIYTQYHTTVQANYGYNGYAKVLAVIPKINDDVYLTVTKDSYTVTASEDHGLTSDNIGDWIGIHNTSTSLANYYEISNISGLTITLASPYNQDSKAAAYPLSFNSVNVAGIITDCPWFWNTTSATGLVLYADPEGAYSPLISYGSVEEKSKYFDVVKHQPTHKPDTELKLDTTVATNNILDNVFQFKYRYHHVDEELSAYGPISDINIDHSFAANFPLNASNYAATKNKIEVHYEDTISDVKNIELVGRKGNDGKFFLIDSIPNNFINYLKKLKNDLILIPEYEYANDEVSSKINFYNNGSYPFVDAVDSGKLFDAVPKLAKAQTMLSNNRLAYGNVLEGYDNTNMVVSSGFSGSGAPTLESKTEDVLFTQEPTYHHSGDTFWLRGSHEKCQYRPEIDLSTLDLDATKAQTLELNFSFEFSCRSSKVSSSRYRRAGNFSGRWNITGISSNAELAQFIVNRIGAGDFEGGCNKVRSFPAYLTNKQQISASVVGNTGIIKIKMVSARANGNGFTNGVVSTLFNVNSRTIAGKFISGTVGLGSFKTGAYHNFGIAYFDETNRCSFVNVAPDYGAVGQEIVDGKDTTIKTFNGTRCYNKFYSELGGPDLGTSSSVNISIYNKPPEWATNYQIYYTGNTTVDEFIQMTVIDAVRGSGEDEQIYLSLSSLKGENWSYNQANNSQIDYDFAPGDRVRFVSYNPGTGRRKYAEYVDLEIAGVDLYSSGNDDPISEDGYFLRVNDPKNTAVRVIDGIDGSTSTVDISHAGLSGGEDGTGYEELVVEIYRPKKNIDEDFLVYYEVGDKIPIANGYHSGDATQSGSFIFNREVGSEISEQPAIVNVSSGDIYFKPRNMVVNSTGSDSDTFFPEDYYLNDFHRTNHYSIGRINVINSNAAERRLEASVYYSEPYSSTGSVNGLSSFNLANSPYFDYNKDFGSIQALKTIDDDLLIFHENKVGRVLVGKDILNTASAEGLVSLSTNVIANYVNLYTGEYGCCLQPESIVKYGNKFYFVDIKRGSVLRLSTDGLTAISDNGMRDFFRDIGEMYVIYDPESQENQVFNLVAGYDPKYDEYIVTLPAVYERDEGNWDNESDSFDEIADTPLNIRPTKVFWAKTLAFNESTDRWTSFYSFHPEYFSRVGKQFIGFKNGYLWKHNMTDRGYQKLFTNKAVSITPVGYNSCYGYQFNSKLQFPFNIEPSSVKTYNAISLESDTKLFTSMQTNIGQTAKGPNNIDGYDSSISTSIGYRKVEGNIVNGVYSSNIITGFNTRFYEDIKKGDSIKIWGKYRGRHTYVIRVVKEVLSNTLLSLTAVSQLDFDKSYMEVIDYKTKEGVQYSQIPFVSSVDRPGGYEFNTSTQGDGSEIIGVGLASSENISKNGNIYRVSNENLPLVEFNKSMSVIDMTPGASYIYHAYVDGMFNVEDIDPLAYSGTNAEKNVKGDQFICTTPPPVSATQVIPLEYMLHVQYVDSGETYAIGYPCVSEVGSLAFYPIKDHRSRYNTARLVETLMRSTPNRDLFFFLTKNGQVEGEKMKGSYMMTELSTSNGDTGTDLSKYKFNLYSASVDIDKSELSNR